MVVCKRKEEGGKKSAQIFAPFLKLLMLTWLMSAKLSGIKVFDY